MVRRVFICYSRRDARYVVGLVKLMRVTGAAVFRDEDSIALGQRWRAEIADGLAGADTVIVFWSAHAFTSEEVRAEYEAAIAAAKSVVPVLLDGTPLTEALQQFQFLDFSELFLPHSPEGLSKHSRDLVKLLLLRIFPDAEPAWFHGAAPAVRGNRD